MYSRLPREILEQIFAHPCITQKDLHQLQLTCKQWNPTAQKHFYKIVSLYGEKHNDHSTMMERLTLLIRSLLILNKQNGRWVKKIHLSSLFSSLDLNAPCDDLIMNVATLLHLCPNVILLIGADFPNKFYEAMPDVHRNGNLQHLEHIKAPDVVFSDNKEALISAYHKSILVFRNTIRNFTIFDGVGRTVGGEDLIPPHALQHFGCVQNLQLLELSRFHLYRMKDYITSCPPTVKFIDIAMIDEDAEAALLPAEYIDPLTVQPQTNVERLSIRLTSSLTTNEMAFLMRMFPSLNTFAFELEEYSEHTAPIHNDMETMVQFLDYLCLIPRVDLVHLWFGVSDGHTLLSRIANAGGFKALSLVNSSTRHHAGISITLNRQTSFPKAASSSNADTSSLEIEMNSSADTHSFCNNTLEMFKGQTLETLCLGYANSGANSSLTKLTPDSMDYIMRKYTGLQELIFNHVEFIPGISRSYTRHLRHLDLNHCQISESYMFELSCQLEHVDHFKFSSSFLHPLHNESSNDTKTIRLVMPYTAFNTISLKLGYLSPYIIKIQAKSGCSTLMATPSTDDSQAGTLEKYDGIEGIMPEIIVQCFSFQEVESCAAFFILP